MTANLSPQPGRSEGLQLSSRTRRLAHRAAALISECHYAQRRWTQVMMSPEYYTAEPGRGPGTYAEFLYRAAGSMWHEPSAHERASCGRGVS